MSTAQATLTIAGTTNGIAVSEASTCTFTAKKIVTHTRDFSTSDDLVTGEQFVLAIIKNIGTATLCVRVGEVNFAIKPDHLAVFSGASGKIDMGASVETVTKVLGFSAKALSGTARARITVIF